MNVGNNSINNYYNNVLNTQPSLHLGKSREKNYDFDSKLLEEVATTSTPVSNSSNDVKDAWEDAQNETGFDYMSIGADGKMTHITQTFAMQTEHFLKTGNRNMFGSTTDSALSMAEKVLHRLNNPLSPITSANDEKWNNQEKDFYHSFIENLENNKSKQNSTTPIDIYEQMTRNVGF